MIRKFERDRDLDAVLQIWLETNASAHAFVPRSYWLRQSALVREALPQAEVYVEAGEDDGQVRGFVGLTGDFIAGLFVRASAQSQGIGRALLQRAKAGRSFLRLGVYKKNPRAIAFYQREGFVIESEGLDENTDEPEFTMAWRKPPAAEQAVP